ncbi:MAG: LysR family transcriptional regulator [Firmicutes bacterium]|nr:LysR family transcriptional regulator [Bacillota bacterium]
MHSKTTFPKNRLKAKCKIWIEADKAVVFGGGRLALLQAIDEYGSINRAAAQLGMSYRAAWGKITATEKRLGIKLVEKQIGGARSGSKLTPEAKKLMDAYRQFKQEAIIAVDNLFKLYFADICFPVEAKSDDELV